MKSLGFAVSLLNVASAISPHIWSYEVRPLVPNATGIQNRIHGGTEAREGQFPFMVLALMNLRGLGYAKCSSSLISSKWVLLAAHCIDNSFLRPEDILLVAQKADLNDYIQERLYSTSFYAKVNEKHWGVQERRGEYFFIHPRYSADTMEHDVGLIRVSSPFVLGSVQTIPLSRDEIRSKKTCTILGWGLVLWNLDTRKLNYVEGKEVSTTKIGCQEKPCGPFICLKQDNKTGICSGDSGSPLVCDGKVWGVASHYVTFFGRNCGDSVEEYYSELYEDLDWIESIYGGGSVTATSLKTVLLCLVFLWLSAKR